MKINLWFDKSKLELFKKPFHKFDTGIHKTELELDYFVFNKNDEIEFITKIINQDIFDESENNLILYHINPWLYPGEDGDLPAAIKDIVNEETKVFAKKHNLTINLSYVKERLPTWQLSEEELKEYRFLDVSFLEDGLLVYSAVEKFKRHCRITDPDPNSPLFGSVISNIAVPIGNYNSNIFRGVLLVYLHQIKQDGIILEDDLWHSLLYLPPNKPKQEKIIERYNYIKARLQSKSTAKKELTKTIRLNYSEDEVLEIFKFKKYDYRGILQNEDYNVHINDQYLMPPQIMYANLCVIIETHVVEKLGFKAATEKTHKCIENHIPFLTFAPMNFYKDMQQQGFKLHRYIDYSFDTIEEEWERFHGFLKEFTRLCKIDKIELSDLKTNDFDILLHNAALYRQKVLNSWKDINELLD